MKKSEHAQKSKDLFFSVFKFCQENDLKIWFGESSSFFTKYVIGSKEDFENAKKESYKYGRSINELNESRIKNEEHYFIFSNNLDKNFGLEPNENFGFHNQHYNKMLIYVFLNNDIEISEKFIEEWTRYPINLAHLFDYKDKNYPFGFIKATLSNNESEKIFAKFLEILPYEEFLKIFQISEESKLLKNEIKTFISDLDNLKVNILFDKITEKIIKNLVQNHMVDNLKMEVSHFLVDVLPKDLADKYSDDFKFINHLLNPKTKTEFFAQEHEEILEKAVFSKLDIYDYFKSAKLTALEYNNIAYNTLYLMAKNSSLKDKGLNVGNVCHNDNDLLLFMSLSDNKIVNKNSMKDLFIQILENCFNSKELITGDFNASDINSQFLQKLVNTSVNDWVLRQELENKLLTDNKRTMKI